MKKMNKLFRHHINDNRGETIVEVIVAFALLSIMLVLFSQGLAAASRSDMKAMETRAAADRAMLQLQKDKISKPKKTSQFFHYTIIKFQKINLIHYNFILTSSGNSILLIALATS